AIAFPVSVAIVTNAFPPDRVGRAIGLVFGIGLIGTAAGPFVGGLLTEVASWRLLFWINVPIALVVGWLALASVEESRDETAPRRIDLPGLALIASGVAAVSIGADKAADWGWTSPATLGLMGAGLLLLAAFVVVEGRVANPLLDLGLFRIPTMGTMLTAGSVGNILYNVVIFSSTLYLQQARDLSPLEAGVVFLALASGASVAGQVSGRLERFPSWLVMAAALVIGGLGSIGLGVSDDWIAYVPFFAVAGFGLGLGWAYTSVATQAITPPEKAGATGGIVLTLLVGLGGIAVAVAASVIDARAGTDLGEVLQDLIVVAGVIALAGAVLVAALGRARRPRAS
ncbi:MAG: MFS transporter, partial [Thermoleophilia bacterium]